jgi:DNA polymerase
MHCLAIDDEEPQLWLPADPVPPVFFAIATHPTNWKVIAHNFDFEREMYENVLVPRYGFPTILRNILHCTQRLAMANAYPAELGLLAQALGLPYCKDPAAAKRCWRSHARRRSANARRPQFRPGMKI